MLRNTNQAWGSVAKLFHWLLAVLISAQFVLGFIAEEAAVSPRKLDLFVMHKSLGITILLLAAVRLGWRVGNTPPAAPAGLSSGERRLARFAHMLLYLLMLAVPLSGWWISDTSLIPFKFYWTLPVPDFLDTSRAASEIAAEVHEVLTVLLLAVVSVHVLAALRHHFVLRNDVVSRMLPTVRGRWR